MSIHVQVRVGVEWVNNFHSDKCRQNDLSYCEDQVVGFYNHMGSHGHIKVFNRGDDNAWETDFRYPNFGGDSLNWSDDVHFCMVNNHGGNSANIVSFLLLQGAHKLLSGFQQDAARQKESEMARRIGL